MAQGKKATAPAAADETQTEPDAVVEEVTSGAGEPGGDSTFGDVTAEGGEPVDGEPVEGVTLADVAALAGVAPAPAEAKAPPQLYVNEGMRTEIELNGFTYDPVTGRKLTAEDLAGVIRGY